MRQTRKILKGQIYYVQKAGFTVGSEQKSGRPAIIVSNNTGNYYSNVVEVVYLTTQCKADMPTHVPILSAIMPEEVYVQVKAEIPYGVGVYVPDRLHHGKDWYDLK